MRHVMRVGSVAISSMLLFVAGAAWANGMESGWWQHTESANECAHHARSAFAATNFSGIEQRQSALYASRGQYTAIASCEETLATLTVIGPEARQATSLYQRLERAWRTQSPVE